MTRSADSNTFLLCVLATAALGLLSPVVMAGDGIPSVASSSEWLTRPEAQYMLAHKDEVKKVLWEQQQLADKYRSVPAPSDGEVNDFIKKTTTKNPDEYAFKPYEQAALEHVRKSEGANVSFANVTHVNLVQGDGSITVNQGNIGGPKGNVGEHSGNVRMEGSLASGGGSTATFNSDNSYTKKSAQVDVGTGSAQAGKDGASLSITAAKATVAVEGGDIKNDGATAGHEVSVTGKAGTATLSTNDPGEWEMKNGDLKLGVNPTEQEHTGSNADDNKTADQYNVVQESMQGATSENHLKETQKSVDDQRAQMSSDDPQAQALGYIDNQQDHAKERGSETVFQPENSGGGDHQSMPINNPIMSPAPEIPADSNMVRSSGNDQGANFNDPFASDNAEAQTHTDNGKRNQMRSHFQQQRSTMSDRRVAAQQAAANSSAGSNGSNEYVDVVNGIAAGMAATNRSAQSSSHPMASTGSNGVSSSNKTPSTSTGAQNVDFRNQKYGHPSDTDVHSTCYAPPGSVCGQQ